MWRYFIQNVSRTLSVVSCLCSGPVGRGQAAVPLPVLHRQTVVLLPDACEYCSVFWEVDGGNSSSSSSPVLLLLLLPSGHILFRQSELRGGCVSPRRETSDPLLHTERCSWTEPGWERGGRLEGGEEEGGGRGGSPV